MSEQPEVPNLVIDFDVDLSKDKTVIDIEPEDVNLISTVEILQIVTKQGSESHSPETKLSILELKWLSAFRSAMDKLFKNFVPSILMQYDEKSWPCLTERESQSNLYEIDLRILNSDLVILKSIKKAVVDLSSRSFNDNFDFFKKVLIVMGRFFGRYANDGLIIGSKLPSADIIVPRRYKELQSNNPILAKLLEGEPHSLLEAMLLHIDAFGKKVESHLKIGTIRYLKSNNEEFMRGEAVAMMDYFNHYINGILGIIQHEIELRNGIAKVIPNIVKELDMRITAYEHFLSKRNHDQNYDDLLDDLEL